MVLCSDDGDGRGGGRSTVRKQSPFCEARGQSNGTGGLTGMSQARGCALLALDTKDCDGASSTTEKSYGDGGTTTSGRVQGGWVRGKAERRLTEWHTAAGGGLGAAGATNSMELAGGGPRKRKKRAASRRLVSFNPGAQGTEERAAILLDRSRAARRPRWPRRRRGNGDDGSLLRWKERGRGGSGRGEVDRVARGVEGEALIHPWAPVAARTASWLGGDERARARSEEQ